MMFKSKNRSVFGIYENSSSLKDAIEELKKASFIDDEVYFMIANHMGKGGFAHVRGSKAPEIALLGVIAGCLAGAIIGWSLGANAPTYAIPIMFALAGAGMCGIVFGAAGGLIGLAFPEYKAKRFQGVLKNGGILLSVHVEDNFRKNRAKQILKDTGARFISTGGEVVSGLKILGSREALARAGMV